MWQQVDAFRELLQEGGQLLAEVLRFTRNAEESLATLDRERKALEREREALSQSSERACREVQFANEQLRMQQEELVLLRERLSHNEAEQGLLNRLEAGRSRTLQKALRETEDRAGRLEEELKQAREGGLSLQPEMVEEAVLLDEARVKCLENELEQTRLVLASERLRRNRAISLIRPTAGMEPRK